MHKLQGAIGKVTGTGVVRDKDGNIKGTIRFEGETNLTENQLRSSLGLVQEKKDVTDALDRGTERGD